MALRRREEIRYGGSDCQLVEEASSPITILVEHVLVITDEEVVAIALLVEAVRGPHFGDRLVLAPELRVRSRIPAHHVVGVAAEAGRQRRVVHVGGESPARDLTDRRDRVMRVDRHRGDLFRMRRGAELRKGRRLHLLHAAHVADVVRAVEVDAIPTIGKAHPDHEVAAGQASAIGDRCGDRCLPSRVLALGAHAEVARVDRAARVHVRRVARDHVQADRDGNDLLALFGRELVRALVVEVHAAGHHGRAVERVDHGGHPDRGAIELAARRGAPGRVTDVRARGVGIDEIAEKGVRVRLARLAGIDERIVVAHAGEGHDFAESTDVVQVLVRDVARSGLAVGP